MTPNTISPFHQIPKRLSWLYTKPLIVVVWMRANKLRLKAGKIDVFLVSHKSGKETGIHLLSVGVIFLLKIHVPTLGVLFDVHVLAPLKLVRQLCTFLEMSDPATMTCALIIHLIWITVICSILV